MIRLNSTYLRPRLPLLVSGLVLLLALLNGPVRVSRAAGGEVAGRYRADESPAGLTAAEWAQVTAYIQQAQPAAANPMVQRAYVKASNTEAFDEFGWAVALSGDTLAVGADGEASSAGGVNPAGGQADNSASNAGAVYIFTRSGGVWSQQAYLKASNTEMNDFFGQAVALSGDTLAVGAYGEDSSAVGVNPAGGQADNSASSAGAVYVFTRSGGVWSQQAYVKASNTGVHDLFGSAVALSGDTLAVGAEGEASSAVGVGGNQGDNSASFAGAVYVFTRSGGVWSQQAYVKAFNPNTNDSFGYAVALLDDTLVVGAPFESSSAVGVNPAGGQADNSASFAGAVYVFTRTNGVWSQQIYLKASNTEANDRFGNAVALSGDTLAVGAYLEDSQAGGVNPTNGQGDNSAFDAGAVYVFTRSGGVWRQQAYVKTSNAERFDQFGYAVALSGDTLVAGAYDEDSSAVGVDGSQADNSASRAGAVYAFTGFGPPGSTLYLPLVVK